MSLPTPASPGTHIATPPGVQVTSAPATARRERLRFVDLRVLRSPSGSCKAEVELEGIDGTRLVGSTVGHTSPQGELRISATAVLRALEQFADHKVTFELVGIRAMRAFDANVVIVAVSIRRGNEVVRRVGCSLAEDRPERAAVLAVLNATNRTMGNIIAAE